MRKLMTGAVTVAAVVIFTAGQAVAAGDPGAKTSTETEQKSPAIASGDRAVAVPARTTPTAAPVGSRGVKTRPGEALAKPGSRPARHGASGAGLRAPPANDECQNATLITCGAVVTSDMAEATDGVADQEISCHFGGSDYGYNTVWYRFVAPAGGIVVAGTCGSPDDTLLAVYSGACGSLTEVACNDDGCGGSFQSEVIASGLAPGQTYYVMAALYFPFDPDFGDVGIETFRLTCPTNLPPNDACAGALPITPNGATVVADNTNALGDNAPGCSGFVFQNNGMWYRFAGGNQAVEVTTCTPQTAVDTRLFIYSGGCDSLVCVQAAAGLNPACAAAAGAATVGFCALTGTTYYVLVTGDVGGATGTFGLAVRTLGACPAANDGPAGAAALNVPGGATGDTRAATADGAPDCGETFAATPGLWYRLAGTGGSVTLTTCDAGTTFDTQVSVFCEPSAGVLGACVGGNDQDPACGISGDDSTLTFCSQLGASYLVLVQGFDGAGAFRLTAAPEPGGCTATVFCAPQGACCVGPVCSQTTQAGCAAAAGTYRGNGSSCATLGTTVTTTTSSPALAIPDNDPTGVSDTITLTGSTLIGDLNVEVNIPDHTFLGDLTIDLTHGSTTVRLWNRQCGGDNGMDITFDDEGTAVVCAEPTAGVYTPVSPLNVFDAQGRSGAWTLQIADLAGADIGTLASWSLISTDGAPACSGPAPCPADFDGSGEVNANDISAYLNVWYNDIVNGTLAADFDHSGETNANDISAYINAWYAAIVNGGTC